MAPTLPNLLTTLLLLAATGSVSARTDLAGCVSTTVPDPIYTRSVLWYVPDTGEICEFLDCGGGRAPPKTTVPGCPLYAGTETVTPKFWTGVETAATTARTSPGDEVETTTSAGGSDAVETTTASVSGSEEGEASTASVTRTQTGAEGSVTTTMVTATTAVETPGSTSNGGEDAEGSASESGSGSASSSSTSTGGAVPTAVGMRVLGAVAGVAAAGLVIA